MADFGAPVAQNVNANPMQGVQTLSGLIGLQRQQQALQIGQQTLQQEQLATQAKATTLKEQQALQQINPNDYMKNGVLDAGAYGRDAIAATPFSGLGVDRAQKALEVQNAQLTVQKSAQSLNEDQRRDVSNNLEAAAQNPNGHWADIAKLAEDYKKQNPGGAPVMDAVMSSLNPQDPWQLTQQKLHSLNVALKGVNTPQLGTAIDKSGRLVGTAQSPMTGNLSAPGGGQGLTPGLAPNQTPGYLGQVAATTTAASGAGNVDNQTFGNVVAASAKSGTVIDLAKKVHDLAQQTRTGKLTGEFADNLTIMQQHDPQATVRQLMEKYAANLKTAVESTGGTDAEREQIGSGFPTPKTMNPDALEEAANYALGHGVLAQQRGANAISHIQKNGSTQGFAVDDASFMKGKSPLTYAPKDQPAATQTGLKSKSGRPIKKVGDHYEYAD